MEETGLITYRLSFELTNALKWYQVLFNEPTKFSSLSLQEAFCISLSYGTATLDDFSVYVFVAESVRCYLLFFKNG